MTHLRESYPLFVKVCLSSPLSTKVRPNLSVGFEPGTGDSDDDALSRCAPYPTVKSKKISKWLRDRQTGLCAMLPGGSGQNKKYLYFRASGWAKVFVRWCGLVKWTTRGLFRNQSSIQNGAFCEKKLTTGSKKPLLRYLAGLLMRPCLRCLFKLKLRYRWLLNLVFLY